MCSLYDRKIHAKLQKYLSFSAPIGVFPPNVTILNSTAAQLTWKPPSRENGILLYYEIRRLHVKSISAIKNFIINASSPLSLTMIDLLPYAKYRFQLAASTKGGKTWSDVTEVRTFEDGTTYV